MSQTGIKRSPKTSVRPPKKRGRLKTLLFVVGGVGGAALAGGGWKAWEFIQDDLAPTIAASLTESINRPVILGELQHFSFHSLTFGPSSVPPQTAVNGQYQVDQDSATVEAVEVKFDLWDTLWNRRLNLDLTLVEPKAYVGQTKNGAWIETQLTSNDEESLITLDIDRIKIERAEVTADPYQGEARQLEQLNGVITLKDNNETIHFNLAGNLDSGGHTRLQGQWLQPSERLTLKANTKAVDIVPLLGFAPNLPVSIRAGQVTGAIEVKYQPHVPLQIKTKAQVKNANARLRDPNIQMVARSAQADLNIRYTPDQLPLISGDVQLQRARMSVPEDLVLKTGRSQFQDVQQVDGTLKFLENSKRVKFDLAGDITAGGQFKAQGESALDLTETNVRLRGQGVPATLMDRAYGLPINIQQGTVNANVLIKLRADQTPNLNGWAKLQDVDASIPQMPQAFYDANGYVRVNGLTAKLDNVTASYGQVPLIARGNIDPERGYDLAVQVPPTDINTALNTLQVGSLPVPLMGTIKVPNLRVTGGIEAPILAGTVLNQGDTTIDRVPFKTVAADFRLVLPELKINNIVAQPTDGGQVNGTASYIIVPDGELFAALSATDIPGDAIAQRYGAENIPVGPVAAQIQVTGQPTRPITQVNFQAPMALYSTAGKVLIAGGEVRLRDTVSQVAGGQVLTHGLLRDGQITAQVQPKDVQLSTFSPELRGVVNGSVAIATPLANVSAQTLRAEGDLNFSEGLSLIEAPIDAAIAWDGRRVLVRNARAPGFHAKGAIGAELNSPLGPQLTTLDLALGLNDFPLQTIADLSPTAIELGGSTDLTGTLSGTLTAPSLKANLAVHHLAVSQVPFESYLAGNLAYSPQGTNLNLAGDRDRIQADLASDFLPHQFLVQRHQAIAKGRRQGDQLMASLEQFPLQMLGVQPLPTFGRVAGIASGKLTANLNTYAATGDFRVRQPAWGRLVGDRLSGQFEYQNNVARLMGGELKYQDSSYSLDAALTVDEDPDVTGQLRIANGQIADVLAVAQGVNGDIPRDRFAMADELDLDAVGHPEAPLSIQLQRLSEVQELIAQTAAEQPQTPISLAELTGQYNGQIAFQGSVNQGVKGDFDLLGTDFRWGNYHIENAVAKGRLNGTHVTFEPLRLATGDRTAQYIGSLGLEQQSGQLRLSQIPLDTINQFAMLPVPVSGDLNSTATIGGSILNPSVDGTLNIANGQVNDISINEASAAFNYAQARLRMTGLARMDNPEPLTLNASIPYALPFGVTPTSDQIAVDVALKNQGLGLVSLFTDQVAWVEGRGLLDLRVRGSLNHPVANGLIQLEDAVLTTPNIENPITGVNGSIQFDQNLLKIPKLAGNYDLGQILVSGSLPIFDSSLGQSSALTVQLNDLDLKLQHLYQGKVGGTILVSGSALAPDISGQVEVQNGKVILTDVAGAGGGDIVADNEVALGEDSPITFNQLRVTLGDRVRISQPPVLSFIAGGNLTVNGTLSAPRPEGRITFNQGKINLFTSRFRIDAKRENVAIFDPRYGLDPYLDIGMRSTVFDTVRGRTSDLSDFETIPASSLGSVQSVRIYAKVNGLASDLQANFKDVVEITSEPQRSEGDIVALLGGGVTDSVQAGDVQNAALNVASSALLGNVQDLLSGVLGNRATVNAFPILLPNEDDGSSVLSFGAEANYDVTNRFSISALQILTGAQQPTIFNLKYRLTDKLTARTAIGSDGEGVGIVEYRMKF